MVHNKERGLEVSVVNVNAYTEKLLNKPTTTLMDENNLKHLIRHSL